MCPHGRDENHITGQQGGIFGHVAEYQQIVQIEMGNGLPITPQLNVAEGALDRGTAGGKQSGDQCTERAEGIGSGSPSLTYDENLDGAQLPHLDIQVKALVNAADGIMNVLPDLCIRQAGNVDLAYLGKINRTGTVNGELGVEVNLPPDADHQLITRSKNIVGSDVHLPQRSKGRRHLAKQAVTVHRKQIANGSPNQQLEVCRRGRGSDGQQSRLFQRRQLGLRIAQTALVDNALHSAVQA